MRMQGAKQQQPSLLWDELHWLAQGASGVIPTDRASIASCCSLRRGARPIAYIKIFFSPSSNKVTPSISIWMGVSYRLRPVNISGTVVICCEVSDKPPLWRSLWGHTAIILTPVSHNKTILAVISGLSVSLLVHLFMFVEPLRLKDCYYGAEHLKDLSRVFLLVLSIWYPMLSTFLCTFRSRINEYKPR